MSLTLLLGILAGLAIGGPLYYAYKVFTGKRKQAARMQLQEMMRQKQAGQQEGKQPAEQPAQETAEEPTEEPTEEPVEEQRRP